ncbi:prepilin-type N-terminal cleavage/methylation domain-containing protein [Victivallis vadensis]|uniref:Prepilin-type N-terminal cleavage/methylation domain-containing protein n=1 Tax=Victivallis vadensis TaxID=172901 RepID=A0A2U1ASI7_9BACT|nr:prepilin-type N-terminal cleavage/methylation domain-containing protein [Victivallis vadensis]PVY39380.1 prepilin-type N-terminal cleavage/methylation domain-containing protein [Victivallis vadensis]
MYNMIKDKQMQYKNPATSLNIPGIMRQSFTLIELLIVIAIIAIVVTSKAGFFLQFSAIFAFKAL